MKRVRNMSTAFNSWLQANVGAELMIGGGDVFFLVPTTSSTAQFIDWLQANGVDESHYFTSFPTAYAALTDGRNDILVVLPGNHAVTAAQTWAKSYTHLVGAGALVPVNQRARISTVTTTVSPLITISGSGCTFKNVMFDHQGSNATTAGVVCNLSGARNRFESVTFRHIGALATASDTYRALQIASSNGEHYFKNCTIGADTTDAGTASNYVIEFNGANQTARNVFEDCIIFGNGSANQCFILATTTSSLSSVNIFKRCIFYNNDNGSMDAMTQAFSLAGASGGHIILMDCLVYGASAYESSDSGVLYGRNAYAAATTDTAVALTY